MPSYKITDLNSFLSSLCCSWLLVCGIILAPGEQLRATGSPELYGENDDPVMLLIGEPGFGNFASYTAPVTNRINIRMAEAGEVLYLGLSRAYRVNGEPQNFGQYFYRIRRASDGEVVQGPFILNSTNENISSWQEAAAGPAELNAGGYPTPGGFRFVATQPGDYILEFSGVRYLGLWDITVGKDGVEQRGRVFSQNWAFRVPELEPELPDCVWGAELHAKFYSYTADGFVTMIDFENSGFQPLSFNLAFNRTGPGNSNDPQADRMSVPNENRTGSSAEHLIFIDEPDPNQFPDGACGAAFVDDRLRCTGAEGFCIPVEVSLPGQVEMILDFNDNEVYDPEIDVLLLHTFGPDAPLTACVEWNGRLADGSLPPAGSTVDLITNYTQGVQHWALFDGELMSEGFCVSPIRPICGADGNAQLYYDDRLITDASGTDAPRDGRTGCDCATPDCRTWANFDPQTNDCNDIDDDLTTGYGDKNTLNTWWFASIQTSTSFDIPLLLADLSGPVMHCPGDVVTINLNWRSSEAIQRIVWTGPNDFRREGAELTSVEVTASGTYRATVYDRAGCIINAEYLLTDVVCTLDAVLVGTNCDDNGTEVDPSDDTFTAQVTINGSNSAGWSSPDAGLSGAYGTTVELGPFPIADGDVVINWADNEYICCSEVLIIPAPAPCSEGCAITETRISDNVCDDNGTPLDPTDDTFTFRVLVDGVNLSGNWMASNGQRGNYGEAFIFGPYPIADGNREITFTDFEDGECAITVEVTPPATCSDQCHFETSVTNVSCDDSGTPHDPLDDQFYFDLMVMPVNGTSVAYQVEGLGLSLYGTMRTYGPFLIRDGDLELMVGDVARPDCNTLISVAAPAACSDLCGIEIADFRTGCDDGGTEDGADDQYYYEILVNSLSNSNTSWVASDGSQGAYGTYVRSVGHNFRDEEFSISISDATNAFCSDSVAIRFPRPELRCPDDVSEAQHHGVSVQRIDGELSPERLYFDIGVDVSCWLNMDYVEPGGRGYDRFTFRRPGAYPDPSRLYTFYLFSDVVDSSAVGALFTLSDFEPIDCCNLTNDGPRQPFDGLTPEGPVLPDSLHVEGMVLSQQFSVLLNAGIDYSLVTTTWSDNAEGRFRWVILSSEESPLELTDPFRTTDFSTEHTVPFDWRTYHLSRLQNQLNSTAMLGRAVVNNNCGRVEVSFRDDVSGDCDSMTLSRSFDFTIGGQTFSSACSQKIGMSHLGLDEVILPPAGWQFSCSDHFPILANGNPDPDYTGRPSIFDIGKTVFLTESGFSDLRATFVDVDSLLADGARHVWRHWTLVDHCLNEQLNYVQFFKMESGGAPRFLCPSANHYCPIIGEDIMLFATDHLGCTADVTLPLPELINICDTSQWEITTRVFRVDTLPDGRSDTTEVALFGADDQRILLDLETGDYFVQYRGYHPVELPQEVVCRFRVADTEPPSPICKSTFNLSLPGSGRIRIRSAQVDRGSYDNCGIARIELRRNYDYTPGDCGDTTAVRWSEWLPYVEFGCCDVGGSYAIEMRVIDAAGNLNFCTSYATISDNTLPYCTGLEDVSASCDDLPGGFSTTDTLLLQELFGVPTVIDNCSAYARELTPVVIGDDCAPEAVIRRFLAVDEHGNVSAAIFEQRISITPNLHYALHFPRDTESDCIDETDVFYSVFAGCDSITYDFIDSDLPIISDECRRIARTYTVTNWCEWNGLSPAILINRDEDCNGAEGDRDVWVIRTPDTAYVDADSLFLNDFPLADARGTDCDGLTNPTGYWRGSTSTGRWAYTQYIRVFDETPPVIEIVATDTLCADSVTCLAEVRIDLRLYDACELGPGSLTVSWDFDADGSEDGNTTAEPETLAGGYPEFSFRRDFPIGSHRVLISATDECGNTVSRIRNIEVLDCYVPPLICNGGQIYNLEALQEVTDIDNDGLPETAAVLVEAGDLGSCLLTECSDGLRYSVNRAGDTVDVNQTSLYLDCTDRYQVELEIYVWDEAENPLRIQPDGSIGGPNWRSCTVLVFVQDPNLACPNCQEEQSLTIEGRVFTEQGDMLEDVTVSLNEASGTTYTTSNGRYHFLVDAGKDYRVRAHSDHDLRAGLSTLDVVMLYNHVLGNTPLIDPFLLLAADVNRDGQITVQDVLALQSVILGRSDGFPNNGSWRFVTADWDGSGPMEEAYDFVNLTGCSLEKDFVGIKVGDLNRSYAGIGHLSAGEGRSDKAARISGTDPTVIVGDTVEVPFTISAAESYQGIQLAMRWSSAALEYLGYASASMGPAAVNADAATGGLIKVSHPERLPDEALLTLRFRALKSGRVSDWLSLCPNCDPQNEIYAIEGGNVHPLSLQWNPVPRSVTVADAAIVVDLSPNPVRTATRLTVRVGIEQQAQLTIRNVEGRIIQTANLRLGVGDNPIRIDAADWPAGVYTYSLALERNYFSGKLFKQ